MSEKRQLTRMICFFALINICLAIYNSSLYLALVIDIPQVKDMNLLKCAVLFLSFSVAVSCGGGGGDSSGADPIDPIDPVVPVAPVEEGVGLIVDTGPIQGLSYSAATESGITDVEGKFLYKEGEVVTFKMGKVVVGAAFGAPLITTLDITRSFDATDTDASNLTQLLQTLDTDNNPANGITLPAEIASLDSNLDISDTVAVEKAINATLVGASAAQANLTSNMNSLSSRAVYGTYERVTIGSTNEKDCPVYIDAEIEVSQDINGNRSYAGALTLVGGGVNVFSANDQTIGAPEVSSDLDRDYRVSLNTYEGVIRVHTESRKMCQEIRLTTDSNVNLPPIVGSSFHVTTIPGCSQPSFTYDYTPSFYAGDRDGYIVGGLNVEFARHGTNSYVGLIEPGDSTACNIIANSVSWNPAAPYVYKWYCTHYNDVLKDIPCDEGLDWKLSATDNEGLTSYAQGSAYVPGGTGGGATSYRYVCYENYNTEDCQSDIDYESTISSNTIISIEPQGSCDSLVPVPRLLETWETDEGGTEENVIIDYASYLDGPRSSCFIRIPK